jgi:hypothetical protein
VRVRLREVVPLFQPTVKLHQLRLLMKLLILPHLICKTLYNRQQFYAQVSMLILLKSSNSSNRQVLTLFVPLQSRSVYFALSVEKRVIDVLSTFSLGVFIEKQT